MWVTCASFVARYETDGKILAVEVVDLAGSKPKATMGKYDSADVDTIAGTVTFGSEVFEIRGADTAYQIFFGGRQVGTIDDIAGAGTFVSTSAGGTIVTQEAVRATSDAWAHQLIVEGKIKR